MIQNKIKLKLTKRLHLINGCGTVHDRDVNAAVNTLIAGLGERPETLRESGLKSYSSCYCKELYT